MSIFDKFLMPGSLNKLLITLFIYLLRNISLSKLNNNYIIQDIKYNKDKTSVSVKIKYDKSKQFSIYDYDLINIRKNSEITLIENLTFEFHIKCDKIFHFTIRDTDKQRSEPEYYLNENMDSEFEQCGKNYNLDNIGFKISNINEPFSFILYDKDTKEIYYAFDDINFLYTDTLISFQQLLTTKYIYGFGERNHNFNLDIGRYTIWGNDTTITYRDLKDGGWNLMGHQPIGLHRTKNNKYLGFIFLNANAQDVIIKNFDNKIARKYNNFNENDFSYILRHVTVGGIINYYITLGNTAENAILNMHKIYGHPIIPPFWGLGWHQCRWGYHNTENLKIVRNNYIKNDIPLDALWTDIDMMDENRNFILNKNEFSDMPQFINYLHKSGQHFVALIDYAIPKKNYDPYYKLGIRTNAFLYSNFTKQYLISYVWPGESVFPDFFVEAGKNLWKKGLKDYEGLLNFDGMWIDMNEPAMIGDNRGNYAEILSDDDYDKSCDKYLNIPYQPGSKRDRTNLSHKSISVNAYSRLNDPKNNFYTMYNIKTLISKNQLKITNEYLNSVNKRPFLVSRANTIGHGKYAFHWLGDNKSNYNFLKWSISGIFNYNIFGVPFSGADICGFHDSATDELCARWHILGSFYPFSRNHNVDTGYPQEPWEFNSDRYENYKDDNRPLGSYTLFSAKNGIKLRYSLMRYAYSQFMMISLGKKGAYFKPGFFEFENDEKFLNDENVQNTHILVGDSIYFIPCLSSKQNEYEGYFPNANFNNLLNGKSVVNYNEKKENLGSILYLDGSMTVINAFIIGGKIIPFQNTEKVLNSYLLRKQYMQLIINPDHKLFADGYIYYDDDNKDVIKNKDFSEIYIKFENYEIIFEHKTKAKSGYPDSYEDKNIEKIILLRGNELKKNYNLNDVLITLNDGKIIDNDVKYINDNDTLNIIFSNPIFVEDIKKITFKEFIKTNEVKNEENYKNNRENKKRKNLKNNIVFIKSTLLLFFIVISLMLMYIVRTISKNKVGLYKPIEDKVILL